MDYKLNKIKQYLLIIGDICVLYLSLYLTLFLRYQETPNSELWQQHLWPFSAIFFVWLIIFYISNLYDLTSATNNAKFYGLTVQALLINFLLGAAFFYLMPQIGIAPKTNLLLVTIITAVVFLLWRQIFNIILKSYLPKNNVAIIGFNNQVMEIIKKLNDHPQLGLNISFIVYDGDIYEKGLYKTKILKDVSKIKNWFVKEKISLVILAEDLQKSDELRTTLFSCIHLGLNFVSLFNFYEKITGKVPVYSINQMWFLENLNEGGNLWFDRLKRSYDLVLALFVFIITLPFWPLIGLMIKLSSRGSIFYIQKRIGKNNQIFNLIKFRTMRQEGNSQRPTVPDDPRITGFGNFLRKTRIDEIPQIINIIKGEMSFIGPRPERPELAQQLQTEIPFYNERILILPGVTGWDQVCGEYHSPTKKDTIKKLQYDLYYIKNRSIFMDLIIILKTIRTILRRSGV